MTYEVGHTGSSRTGLAVAEYLVKETLRPTRAELDRYYPGSTPTPVTTRIEQLGRAVVRGDITYGHALNRLVEAELAARPPHQKYNDYDALERRISDELSASIIRADFTAEVADIGGTTAVLRPDLSPRIASLLQIPAPNLPLTVGAIGNLLNGKTLLGNDIAGKRYRGESRSVADVFGLHPRMPPTGQALTNVLAGLRADGTEPRSAPLKFLPPEVVAGALKRFQVAMQIPQVAGGGHFDRALYRRHIHATKPPIGFVGLTFSASKALSAAWALAPTEAERTILLTIHQHAVADAMLYAETILGVAKIRAGDEQRTEPGKLAWLSFQHYTARPAIDIERHDSAGNAYTERHALPVETADPDVHTHVTVPNLVVTKSGRVSSLDLDLLGDDTVKEIGAIYQAYVARHAREYGIETTIGKHGETQFSDVLPSVQRMLSKRTVEAEQAAIAFARERGIDWHALSGKQKSAILDTGADLTRRNKTQGQPDFESWQNQAAARGYHHRSILRPDQPSPPPLSDEQRRDIAYRASLDILEDQFSRSATLNSGALRVAAARGFILGGISDNPAEDIAAVTARHRSDGVRLHGEATAIQWMQHPSTRGKPRWKVTTDRQIDLEVESVALARTAARDRSASLSPETLDRASAQFLARNPHIDPTRPQWRAQQEMIHGLTTQGRIAVGIGASGSGKSTLLEIITTAAKAEGRTVYGSAVAWRQTSDLAKSGITNRDRAAMAAFIRRVEKGRYHLDRNSTVLIDEMALLDVKQLHALLTIQRTTHAQIILIGDPEQMKAIGAGEITPLLHRAIGGRPLEILTSIRQTAQREIEIVEKLRDAKTVPKAIAMKREAGDIHLIAGGSLATVRHAADTYMNLTTSNRDNPAYTLSVATPSNAHALDIGSAIRERRLAAGEIGPTLLNLRATDQTGAEFDLSLSVNDKVRLFSRILTTTIAPESNTTRTKQALANNGDVVTILALSDRGMTARNDTTGVEGNIDWNKLREHPSAPVKLSLGYARTVNTDQGSTVTESLFVMPDGTRSVTGNAAYTAGSRQTTRSIWIIDEASVRRSIAADQPMGAHKPIHHADIWKRIDDDLSRKVVKTNATDLVAALEQTQTQSAQVYRGTVRQVQRTTALAAQPHAEGRHSALERAGRSVQRLVPDLADHIRTVQARSGVPHRQAQEQGQGRSL